MGAEEQTAAHKKKKIQRPELPPLRFRATGENHDSRTHGISTGKQFGVVRRIRVPAVLHGWPRAPRSSSSATCRVSGLGLSAFHVAMGSIKLGVRWSSVMFGAVRQ
jgi:hypothetical protein